MPVINGVYLKDFAALPSAVVDANIIPIAISGNQIAYRTTVGGIVTDARVTSKLLTGLSVTGGAVVATDTILQAFGKVQNQINSKVSSVGLTMPAAFSVANSPITSAGTLAVTAIGAASQYIRGDGALADFPTTGGGGSSVAYYLNGSVSQGTIGGNAYYEMNKTPVIGTGTDFTIAADGYIAQFITDANDPASLLIPAGNWNVEMYFSASSSGGTPSFYVEVYKYNGTTFTLLGSSATTPEGITNGTAIDIYYTSVGIPETVLAITDRLAIRVYVTHSGRTITLHTEDNHLSEIVTTFSNGLTALNGLTKQAQYFAVGSTGTDFNISSSVDTHTFNIPDASASNRGLITTGTQTIAGDKTFTGNINASPTSGNAIQAYTTSSVAIQVGSTTGGGLLANSTTGAAISGNATGTGGHGIVGQASGTAGAGGYFSGGSSATYAVFATATGSTTTALYGTANSASYPVQRLVQFGAGAIAFFDNSGGTVVTISNAGNLTANSFVKTGGTSSQFLKADGSVDTNTYQGAITLGAIGITPNANAASLVGSILNLQPANASFGGVVTTGTQTIAGDKNFTGNIAAQQITSNLTSGYAFFTNNITNGFGGYFGVSGTGSHSIYAGAASGNSIQARNNSSTYATINVINDGSGNIATFGNSGIGLASITNAGGLTLTGALSGTSATFSGNVTLSAAATNKYIEYTNNNGSTLITNALNNNSYITGALSGEALILSGTIGKGLRIGNTADNVSYLSFTSTGAATFSSSVTSVGNIVADSAALMGQVPTYGTLNAQFSHKDRAGAGEYSFLSASTGETFINSKTGAHIYFRVNNGNIGTFFSTGNLLIGTGTTDAGYKLDVNGKVRTNTGYAQNNGGVSMGSNVATTIFTLSGDRGLYIVYVSLSAGDGSPANYSASAMIAFDTSASRIMQQTDGSNLFITISGNNIQARQTSGNTNTVSYSLIKII